MANAQGRDLYIDAPLTNLVQGFAPSGMIVRDLFPITPVSKQGGKFWIWNKDDFFRTYDDNRAPKTNAKRITATNSQGTYFCSNHALGAEIAFEDMVNADATLRLRETRTKQVVTGLELNWENRVASQVTSTSNVGSSTTLTGTSQWSDFTNSDPIDDIMIGQEAIRSTTGLKANVGVIPIAVMRKLIQHPQLVDRIKFTGNLSVTINALQEFFELDKILVPSVVQNTANEGGAGTYSDVWGKDVFLAHINAANPDPEIASYGYSFRWTDPKLGSPLTVERWNDPNNGKFENIEAGFYQEENIVSKELAYLIKSAIA